MSVIVLVHGIAQEQRSADSLEASWLPALVGGVRAAGSPHLADELWRAARPGQIDTRMAFYGDLFLKDGAQGAGDDEAADSDLAEELARAWLETAASRGSAKDRAVAAQVLAQLTGDQSRAQGAWAALRPAVNGLTRIPWFAPMGIAAAGRFVKRALGQVTRYLTDDAIRAAAIGRVKTQIGPETRLVIGHSLGSVVGYETLFEVDQPLALITLGSPLGLRRVVYDRLRPQPPRIPPPVQAWTNIADVDDLVASVLDLRRQFPPGPGQAAISYDSKRVDNGAAPHAAEHYLGKASVGAAVIQAIA